MAASLIPGSSQRLGEGARDYLFDMIHQLAQLARRSDEIAIAIHLEAILAARRYEIRHETE